MRRLRDGELIAGAAGASLLAALFLDWFGASAWEAFAVVDLLLALLALVPLGLVVLQVTRRSPALPTTFSVLTTVAGGLAVLLVVWRLADQPGPDDAVPVHAGAWLGLLAAVLIALGGWRSMRVERIPDAPAAPVETLPAPPPYHQSHAQP